MLTREVFPGAEAGDSDYRLAERFFDRYEGDWFKIDRRDGSPWVEPTPEACRRASLDTAGKHTVETQDSDGTADDTGQSEAEANAQSFLRRRRTIEDDAERGHLLGEFARKRQATEDRFHAFEDFSNARLFEGHRRCYYSITERTGGRPDPIHVVFLSPDAKSFRPETRSEPATDARYTENGQTVLCDGGTADGQDPLAPIREHEEVIREKVVKGKDDDLAAWGRVLLALANDRQPDPDDLQRLELPGGGRGFQSVLHARTAGAPAGRSEVAQQVRRVLAVAKGAEKPEKEP